MVFLTFFESLGAVKFVALLQDGKQRGTGGCEQTGTGLSLRQAGLYTTRQQSDSDLLITHYHHQNRIR